MYPQKLDENWKQTGSRLEVDWKKTGSRLEADWKQTGSRLEVDLKQTGSTLEVDWKRTGKEAQKTSEDNFDHFWKILSNFLQCYFLETLVQSAVYIDK